MGVLIFSTNLFETFLIPRGSDGDMIVNVCCYSCKMKLFLSDFKESLIFSEDFPNAFKNQNSK